MAIDGIPTPQAGVEVTLTVPDAPAAAAFYAAAFGAESLTRFVVPQSPPDITPVKCVNMRLGGLLLHVSTAIPRRAATMERWGAKTPQSLRGFSTILTLRVADVDAAFARATSAGARGVHPPEEAEAYGERIALVEDPFGHPWGLAQTLRTVTMAEHNRIAAATSRRPDAAPRLEPAAG